MTPELAPHELCIHCMQILQNQQTCPHCGQDNRHYKPHPLYLKPYTLLQEQYAIGKSIGQGGFGITYIGLDVRLQKRVAIKEYVPTALATRDFISATILPIKQQEPAFLQGLNSFLHEARNLAKFDHPHIVHVHNFFEENQTGYMVMDYLEGQSLIDILMESNGRLSVNQTLDIMLPILDALSEVHAEHIYHRDISPHNIYILTDGTPILIDFGAARHIVGENSRSLDLVLKHGYSPIEQYSGKGKIGAWTDIYACGALMYVMLVGSLPPAATDRFYEDGLISLKAYPNLNIPDSIIETIDRALSVKAEHRFQTVAAFKAALLGQAIPEPILPESKPQSHFLRNSVILSIFIIAMLALIWRLDFFSAESDSITDLQQQAHQYLQQHQIGLAFDTYQIILNRDPNNQPAQEGLQQASSYYEQQAIQYHDNKNFIQALDIIEKGLALFPNQPSLLNIQQRISDAIQAQKTNNQINTLLRQAQQNITNKKYKAAYAQYQSILNLDQNQNDAMNGLQNIKQNHLTQAQDKTINIKQRLAIIKQGLNLFPQNKLLISLQYALAAKQDQQQQIQKLLKMAQRQLKSLYLTEPNDDNAYLSYQKILNIAPNHPQALAGLENIANAYVKLANSEQNIEKSLHFIQKGLKVTPAHTELLRLKANLEKRKLIKPEKPKPVEPKPDPIIILLNQAQQQMNQRQYELAFKTYKKVLKQQNNVSALQGLQKIGATYETLARQQFEQQNFTQTDLWLNKGLSLFPAHAGLLHLRERLKLATKVVEEQPDEKTEIEQAETTVEETVTEPEHNIIFTPSF
ncbi:protein kinase [Candidatus Albibeggiatoa sp. nov. BB20]|uniref:protein kinase domain-containing protein n=1 Tax=Candidatus Albibeggiatoa sp. nov. BB20 TaxID=3162723 RepID=UPI003365885B